VTGERESLSDSVQPLVHSMRALTDLPVAVGFGISTAEHVAEMARIADAVAVGSALVRVIEQNCQNPALERKMEEVARELASGLQRKS
jgi:tryptophan synthase alpha chain